MVATDPSVRTHEAVTKGARHRSRQGLSLIPHVWSEALLQMLLANRKKAIFKTYTSKLNDLKHHARPINLELHKRGEGHRHRIKAELIKSLVNQDLVQLVARDCS